MQKISSLTTNKTLVSWLLLILLALVWGTSFLMVKKSLAVFSPLQIGSFRIMMAGLVFLPWLVRYRKDYPKDKTKYFIASGLLGYLLPAFLFSFAGSKINSSLSGTLNAVTPLFVLIVGALFFQRKIESKQLIGLVLGFLGSLLLIFVGKTGSLSFDNPYVLLVVLATFMYGFNTNIVGKYLTNINPILVSAWSLLGVGIIAGIIFFSSNFQEAFKNPAAMHALLYMVVLGAINSALMAVIFNYVIQIASPLFASSVTYLIPIVAMFVGFLDGEQIFPLHYLGILIILVGVFMINKK